VKVFKFSPSVYKELQALKRKNPQILNKVYKQLQLFQQNPKHHSLRLHKITGAVENTWSISINGGYRLLYIEIADVFYFFKLGSHDEVYRK